MIRVTNTGMGLSGVIRELKVLTNVVRDTRPTLNQVVHPYIQRHVRLNVKTLGAHGGGPIWDFSGEPIYEYRKTARLGADLGSKPLHVDPEHAELIPSLIEPGHPDSMFRLTADSIIFGSLNDHAEKLLMTGGIGPYGERFPARNPFVMTAGQRAELADLVQHDLSRRLKSYAPPKELDF